MGSLIAGMLDALGFPAGLAGDGTPYVPSAPVEIGTSGPRHGVAEIGSWQVLLLMFVLVVVLGAAVLMYVVWQRARLLKRRRVRRMGEVVAATTAAALPAAAATLSAETLTPVPISIPIAALTLTSPAPPRTTSATPGRRAPNA